MSRFLSNKYASLEPYTPGEQPKTRVLTKLNTNESPFPPMPEVVEAVRKEAEILQLYPDPDSTVLRNALAKRFEVDPDMIICNNGSDETLDFAFLAYCDASTPAVFPSLSYGFYPVFAEFTGVPYTQIPLKDDFSVDIKDYIGINKTIFIANPNAPTGICLASSDIEMILRSNPDNMVIVDEAYVDFGGRSCLPLIKKYDNILITQTYSKSRSLAGGRLGYAFGCPSLIQDLNTIRYSTNPYNLDSMTLAAGLAVLENQDYYDANCAKVMETRAESVKRLKSLGFEMTESSSNFLFAKHPAISGEELYKELKSRGVLVRFLSHPRIAEYVRITVGSPEQMDVLFEKLSEILVEK